MCVLHHGVQEGAAYAIQVMEALANVLFTYFIFQFLFIYLS
jgi:hypothetical protein